MSRPPLRTIESAHNASLKEWRKNLRHPERPEYRWLPVEGPKQIGELASRLTPELVIVSADSLRRHQWILGLAAEVVLLPEPLLGRLSDVQTNQGVIAFFRKPSFEWSDLPGQILYLNGIQDPGNLGTIIRTAAAAGRWGLVTAPGTVSCFNAKVIRATAGYLFQVPFLEGRLLSEMTARGFDAWAADSASGTELYSASLEPPVCVVVGSEGGGSTQPIPRAVRRLHIPMEPCVESLNAAVSAALVLYETRRRNRAGPPAGED